MMSLGEAAPVKVSHTNPMKEMDENPDKYCEILEDLPSDKGKSARLGVGVRASRVYICMASPLWAY